MNGKEYKNDIEFLLSEYLDGNLGAAAEAELAKRLETDGELREQLRMYTALDERLTPGDDGALDDIDYDAQKAEIIARVERKVLLEGPPRRRLMLRPAFRVLAAAASVLIVVGVTAIILRSPQPTAEVNMVARAAVSQAGTMTFELTPQDVPVAATGVPAGTIVATVGGPSPAAAQMGGIFGVFQ